MIFELNVFFFAIQDNGAFVVLCGPNCAVRRSYSGRKDRLFILKPTTTISFRLFLIESLYF